MQMIEKSIFKNNSLKLTFSLISVLLFVYIILFEFILPINQILPKPSILIESIPSLINDKSLVNSYFYTLSIVYLTFIATYFIIRFFFSTLLKFAISFQNILSFFKSSEYILPIFLILIFNLWFGEADYGEVIFTIIILMAVLKTVVLEKSVKVKEEYISSALSLGLGKKETINKVIWKSVQPDVYGVFLKYHFLIWTYVLVYEFINKTDGIGNSIYNLLRYKDFVYLLLIIIVLIITLTIFSYLMKIIKSKYFYWESLDE